MHISLLTKAVLGIAVLGVVSSGVYFFAVKDGPNDLLRDTEELKAAILRTQTKLKKEQETLSSTTDDLLRSFPLGTSVQDHMQKFSDLVHETDFIFDDADTSNPELILKNVGASLLLNEKRKTINILLGEWQKKMGVSSLPGFNLADSQGVKADTANIREYIKQLGDLLANLTPENSGLSQDEIDAYLAELPSVGAVDELLATLQVAINTSTNNSTNQNIPVAQSNANALVSTVVTQQSIVQETQNEINNLQNQLSQVNQQIAQSTPIPDPVTTPIPPVTTTSTTPTIPTNNGTDYVPPPKRAIVPTTGIIVQPGPPVLIPGIDDH